MQILPINNYSSKTFNKQKVSFAGRFSYAHGDVPKNVLQNIQPNNLTLWDRNTVCTAFKNLIEEHSTLKNYANSQNFQKIYQLYKSLGLRGMLYTLGQPNSETLKDIMGENSRYKEIGLSTPTKEFIDEITIKNYGPWGFLNNLFNRNTKNEIIISFRDKLRNNLDFSLDKSGDYVVDSTLYTNDSLTEYKVSYYANKDGVKDEILPKSDLYLPAGL